MNNFKTLSFPLPVLYRGTMEADREPIAAVDTAKQRVIDASRECAMAAVGGRFNGSLRAALSSNLFPSATRHHVNQAFKMIMASPAMIAACETAERERTATIESDEEEERWQILVAARCAPDDERGTRFSVSGCMIFFHGCLFHWFSKMQRSVSLSSAEAEFFGGMMAARDLVLRSMDPRLRCVLE